MPPKATLSYTVLTTDEEWAAALKPDAEKGCLAVVECYAAWCGPSEAVTNTLTRMSAGAGAGGEAGTAHGTDRRATAATASTPANTRRLGSR